MARIKLTKRELKEYIQTAVKAVLAETWPANRSARLAAFKKTQQPPRHEWDAPPGGHPVRQQIQFTQDFYPQGSEHGFKAGEVVSVDGVLPNGSAVMGFDHGGGITSVAVPREVFKLLA